MKKKLKITPTPDGGATIAIPEGYLGHCHCGADAKHEQWCEFDPPLPAMPAAGIPECRGVWTFVCPAHYRGGDA